jgi:erythromycin esterase
MKRTALGFLLLLVPLALFARSRAVRSGAIETPAAWLRHRALGHESFARLVASSDVVALGDVTHATHELYAAKQSLVPQLVARGFRVIAFEAPYSEFKALDEYVLHGTGDPAAILNIPLYWFWDTNEILDLVRWMRAQNAAGLTPPIRIAGVDPTSPRVTAAEVIAYLQRVDPYFATKTASIYHCIREGYQGTNRCRTAIATVRESMLSKRDLYVLASSADEYEEMLYAARVVEQGERVLADGMNVRDEPMAENVLRFVARGQKVIVLGHNEHWGRTRYQLDSSLLHGSAGAVLGEALGDRYFVLGSVILDGTFLAVQSDPSVRSRLIRTQVMTEPSHDDYGVLFSQAGRQSMIVPLRGPLPSWLAGTHRMRFAGSTLPIVDVPADFGAKFDGVLYVRTSTPTQLRHWPRF